MPRQEGIWDVLLVAVVVGLPLTALALHLDSQDWSWFAKVPLAGGLLAGVLGFALGRARGLWPVVGLVVKGALAFLLFYLPIGGGYFVTFLSDGEVPEGVLVFAATWWAYLVLASLGSGVLGSGAARIGEWLLPGSTRGESHPFLAFLAFSAPWLILVSAAVVRVSSGRWSQRDAALATGAIAVGPIALGAVLWVATGETSWLIAVPLGFLAFSIASALIVAFVLGLSPQKNEWFMAQWRSALVGAGVLVAGAALSGGSVEAAVEAVVVDFLVSYGLIVVAAISCGPLLAVFRSLASPGRGALVPVLFTLALVETPVLYASFHPRAVRAGRESRQYYDRISAAMEAADQGLTEEFLALAPDLFEETVRKEDTESAAHLALRLASALLSQGKHEPALSYARRALDMEDLDYVFSDRATWRPHRGGSVHELDRLRERRERLLDLMIYQYTALYALGRGDEAVAVAHRARDFALATGFWERFAGVCRALSIMFKKAGRITDALYSLMVARTVMLSRDGPAEEVQRVDEAIAALREEVGDEKFRTAAAECAARDPNYCGGLVF